MQKPEEMFQRYIWLVNALLSSGDGITFDDLARRWCHASIYDGNALSRATFNRHRESIRNLFGIEIACDRALGSVYYIKDPEVLKTNNIQSWMLRTLTVGNVLQSGLGLHERIQLEEIPMGQEHLQTIMDAMSRNHTLNFNYSKSFQTVKTIEVEPYCLKVFRQRWYLLAHNIAYAQNDLRIYALDRISDIVETEHVFRLPADFDAATYFMDDFGVYTGGTEKVENIVIHAFGRLPDYLRSLPLHPSQREVFSVGNYVEFHYRLRPTYDFRQELLSQADELEVIAPQSLREEFAAVLSRAVQRHEKKE